MFAWIEPHLGTSVLLRLDWKLLRIDWKGDRPVASWTLPLDILPLDILPLDILPLDIQPLDMKHSPTYYAIVPAAGHSLRMGSQHKLLLPWNGQLVIDHLLRAWCESRVQHVIVVTRCSDRALQAACRKWSRVEIVTPKDDPPDMKASIQAALDHVSTSHQPKDSDRWLVAPADLPTLQTTIIDRLLNESGSADSIVVPAFGNRRGHPISLPWSLAAEVSRLAGDQGLRDLVDRYPVKSVVFPSHQYPQDVDTPEDFRRLRGEA